MSDITEELVKRIGNAFSDLEDEDPMAFGIPDYAPDFFRLARAALEAIGLTQVGWGIPEGEEWVYVGNDDDSYAHLHAPVFTVRPVVTVAVPENASLVRGVADASAGRVVDLGSFAGHADEEMPSTASWSHLRGEAEMHILRPVRSRGPRGASHDVSNGTCWCGSGHSWELAKHGSCPCSNPRCARVHYSPAAATREEEKP